jgi:hypothetical protein
MSGPDKTIFSKNSLFHAGTDRINDRRHVQEKMSRRSGAGYSDISANITAHGSSLA